jgi:hypothetical protein
MLNYVTYATEKRINRIKKSSKCPFGIYSDLEPEQRLAMYLFDMAFTECGYEGATLKELEMGVGCKMCNEFQRHCYFYLGIHGLDISTRGNVRYVGTNDLSHVNVKDFNAWVKQIEDKYGTGAKKHVGYSA